MAKVKICGIRDAPAYAAAAAADWVGFVFFAPSPRFVTATQAAGIAQPGGPATVGLFVDPTDDAIAGVLATISLDVLQLVASPARASAIRTRFGRPVWRVVGVAQPADLPDAAEPVDALLLDAKPAADASVPGGNATAFDWSLLRGWRAPMPWLLAGGLTPGNVQSAVARTGAMAVDVSSGVERARGVKEPALIEAFIKAAQAV